MIVLLAGGILLRSRLPVVSFGVVATVTLAGVVLGLSRDPFAAAAWTLWPVAAKYGGGRRSTAVSTSLGVVVVLLGFTAGARSPDSLRFVLLSMLLLAGAWRLGVAMRRERTEAEHAARVENQRAVVAERLRVARDVHDVVSHSLGTVAVTAGVTAHVGSDPEQMRAKLRQIEELSRGALADLQAVLGMVREDEAPARRPQPGLAALPELAGRTTGAGVRVHLTVEDVSGLPSGTELAVYRIVQEGLANATRYAPGCRCVVTVRGTGDGVRVEVADDGGGGGEPVPGAGGFGLVGLRERVAALGGEFTAGPRPDGGFLVRAVLPGPEVAG
jgi:signal transduction histidine kinase